MKVIIPVAGQGTRMLPLTKSLPKEMLPLYNKPIIQHIIFECVMAGFKEIILVSSPDKLSIESFFNDAHPTHQRINTKSEMGLACDIDALDYQISVVYQTEPLGLGHAILCAEPLVGQNDFAVVLPDVVLTRDHPSYQTTALKQMRQSFVLTKQSQIMIHEVDPKEVINYGIVGLDGQSTSEIGQLIEKPSIDEAPSNLAVLGRYILGREIWHHLRQTDPDCRGEIQLTTALMQLLQHEPMSAFLTEDKVFDCGQMAGYAAAFIQFTLQSRGQRDNTAKVTMPKINAMN
ncbi:MAG: NTP transferase domain-containing protein [Shewanellaceae bacterium]|nr:NTP transferase domain-containing protein [Shewanellaceae bacterium]